MQRMLEWQPTMRRVRLKRGVRWKSRDARCRRERGRCSRCLHDLSQFYAWDQSAISHRPQTAMASAVGRTSGIKLAACRRYASARNEREGARAYLVVYLLVNLGEGEGLLVDGAELVQQRALAPVVEGARHVHLVRRVRPVSSSPSATVLASLFDTRSWREHGATACCTAPYSRARRVLTT